MNEANPYGLKVAERIFGLIAIGSDLKLREDGVYLSDGFAEAAASVPALLWAPQCALLDADPQDSPLLPIPFSGKDLAAFLLCPVTRERSLDELKEHLSGVRDGLTRRAVEEADVELTRAEQRVGPFDHTLRIDADRTAGDYQQRRNLNRALLGILDVTNNGLSNDEYTRRIGEANDDVQTFKEASWTARQRADAHEIEWLNRMARELYQRAGDAEKDALANTCLPNAAAGNALAPIGTTVVRASLDALATRDELIAAFGAFTGMDQTWFANLKDVPALKAARKVAGRGGRRSAEPMFDPHQVMLWLVSSDKMKGRQMSQQTGWRRLRECFPAAYQQVEIGDPTLDSPG